LSGDLQLLRILRFPPLHFLVLSVLDGGLLYARIVVAVCLICIVALFVMRYENGVSIWVGTKSGNSHTPVGEHYIIVVDKIPLRNRILDKIER
jgi:hypothetical protein